jgi:thiamine-monophosphate kinase
MRSPATCAATSWASGAPRAGKELPTTPESTGRRRRVTPSLMKSSAARPSEDELIARFFAPLAGEGGLGLKDDAALLRPAPGHDLVLTVDGITAGVHFWPGDPPASVARKALGVNLSDLAAKGAEPTGFLLTLALPGDWTEAWLSDFSQGLGQAAETFACPLLGGDTVRANGPLWISITAIGQVPVGRMVRRGGARPGDRLCVTGTIGDAALGLTLRSGDPGWARGLSQEERDYLVDRYLHPRPRLAVVAALRAHARAAMDISDGLAGDLAKMMRASGTSASVDLNAVPLSRAARAALESDPGLMEQLATGGDDYEILCAVPEDRLASFLKDAAAAGIEATVIGEVKDGEGQPVFRDGDRQRRFERGSFSHF